MSKEEAKVLIVNLINRTMAPDDRQKYLEAVEILEGGQDENNKTKR